MDDQARLRSGAGQEHANQIRTRGRRVGAIRNSPAIEPSVIASTTMNLPIIQRQIKDKSIVREIVLATGLRAVVGIATMAGQALLLHRAGVPL